MSRLGKGRTIWSIWGTSVAFMAVMLGWISMRAMQSEREEQQLVIRSENERLALWRMESKLLPLISRESVWNSSNGVFGPSSVRMVPQHPVLNTDVHDSWPAQQEFVLLRFHAIPQSHLMLLRPDGWKAAEDILPETQSALKTFCMAIAATSEAELFRPIERKTESIISAVLANATPESPNVNPETSVLDDDSAFYQTQRSQGEYLNRSGTANTLRLNDYPSLTALDNSSTDSLNKSAVVGRDRPLVAYWQYDALLLARLVDPVPGFPGAVHGCVLDWERIRSVLCDEVRDLLPNAQLQPLDNDADADNYALASIPARLVSGEIAPVYTTFWSPMRVSLLFAWLGFAICAVAVGILLLGLMRLSQRRADFVSAVSHELRTPLTTFQIYTDLLSDSASLTEEKRTRYLSTLKREATRLTSLVDNVLGFSRLETTARAASVESMNWDSFLETIRDGLVDRANQAGGTIEFITDSSKGDHFQANASGLERIVFNLVDNACKYAAESAPPQIQISAKRTDRLFEIRVRDQGPGLSDSARRRLFKPFSKSATEAARSAHGVGLGLSLSRQLARTMRGDLILERSTSEGTTFLIQLP